MNSNVRILLAVAAFCLPFVAFAQPEQEQAGLRFVPQPITYEVIALFSADTAKTIVNVHYRIGQNFFVFVRSDGSSQRAEYTARGELVVELVNEERVAVARDIRQIALARSTPAREAEQLPDIEGSFSFTVAPGAYSVVFTVDDRESGRSFLDRTRRVTSAIRRPGSLEVSPLLLAQGKPSEPTLESLLPVNRGGNVPFGNRGGVLTQVFLADSQQALSVRWRLKGQLDGFGPRVREYTGTDYARKSGLLKVDAQEGTVRYRLTPSGLNWSACYVPLPFEMLEPGSFTLEVEYSSGQATRKQTEKFRVIWTNRPFSLINPELSLDAIRYIATEEEIDALQSGSALHQAEAFHRFWRARDRDTATAYNEVMAEYYYRVDEAIRKFSTAREGDGYKTDRGRIYILYGPPPKTEKLLQPGGSPTEIWTYGKLGRRFVFIDPTRNGNFILSQTENL